MVTTSGPGVRGIRFVKSCGPRCPLTFSKIEMVPTPAAIRLISQSAAISHHCSIIIAISIIIAVCERSIAAKRREYIFITKLQELNCYTCSSHSSVSEVDVQPNTAPNSAMFNVITFAMCAK